MTKASSVPRGPNGRRSIAGRGALLSVTGRTDPHVAAETLTAASCLPSQPMQQTTKHRRPSAGSGGKDRADSAALATAEAAEWPSRHHAAAAAAAARVSAAASTEERDDVAR